MPVRRSTSSTVSGTTTPATPARVARSTATTCSGSTGWKRIGEVIELSEGDLVLTFNKTIDLMRQIREMLADVKPEHPLRSTLQEAERLLRRGIVEQSL